jgi:hypothetical protein
MGRDTLPTAIPNFITASTPMGLRRLMLSNNARMGAYVRYFDIQQATVNGRLVWVAWFYEDLSANNIKDLEGAK